MALAIGVGAAHVEYEGAGIHHQDRLRRGDLREAAIAQAHLGHYDRGKQAGRGRDQKRMVPGEFEQLLHSTCSACSQSGRAVYQSPPRRQRRRLAGAFIPSPRRPVRPVLAGVGMLLALALPGVLAEAPAPAATPGAAAEVLTVPPPPEEELASVRERLQALRSAKRRDLEQRDFALEELRATEEALSGLNGELAAVRARVDAARARRDALEDALGRREAALADERERLGAALAARYRAGGLEPMRVLLSQQEPAAVSRALVYQEYVARHRAGVVADLARRLRALKTMRERLATEDRRLDDLLAEQRARQAALEATRAERTALVQALEASLRETDQQIGAVQRRESELLELLDDLARLFSDSPAADLEQPFASRRGDLAWPVDGHLAADYGDARAGRSLRWGGVMIAAPRGAPVRAVAHGRVAYADWLPGMGLLLILEHGDGYLSLYGHNETLLRDVGDWVTAGEVVATVGESASIREAGLYFEIRHGRRQENPQRWFASRVPR